MYRVIISESDNRRQPPKVVDLVMKTEKLYELIGRYTVKYGVPDTLLADEGVTELEFYCPIQNGFIEVTVGFARISKGNGGKSAMVRPQSTQSNLPIVPPAPPKPEEPPEERLAAMLEADVLQKW